MRFRTELTDLPHSKAWTLAWPMIVSNISVPLMGLADTAMLGHLEDPSYLGAVAIGANIIALLYWVFAFLRMGTTNSTAHAVGSNTSNAVMVYLSQNGTVAIIIGCGLIAAQTTILPALVWLVTPNQALLELALEYCRIRVFSAPAVLLTYVAMGWLIGLSKTKSVLLVTVSANLLNILLDYIFIVQLDWNVRGAAYATLIAEYFACISIVAIACLHAHKHRWHLNRHFNWHRLKGSLLQGADLFLRTLILLGVINFFNAQSAYFGTDVLAANAIIFQCTIFISHFLDGYALAGETMTAEAIGGKRIKDFHRASAAVSVTATCMALTLSVSFWLLGPDIFALLTNIELVRKAALTYLPWLVVIPLISVGCYMLDGIFIGAGRTRAMRNTMIGSGLLFLTCWWLLKPLGNHGLWLAFVIFNLGRAATLGYAYFWISKHQRWLVPNKKSAL
ncbi:MAG: MATE family efflux transporter [Agarilytica sp.]